MAGTTVFLDGKTLLAMNVPNFLWLEFVCPQAPGLPSRLASVTLRLQTGPSFRFACVLELDDEQRRFELAADEKGVVRAMPGYAFRCWSKKECQRGTSMKVWEKLLALNCGREDRALAAAFFLAQGHGGSVEQMLRAATHAWRQDPLRDGSPITWDEDAYADFFGADTVEEVDADIDAWLLAGADGYEEDADEVDMEN